ILVKICGLRTPEALEAALSAGADMIGLVFHPRSPRYVGLREARALAERARGRALTVALTVDAPDALLRDIAEAVRPDLWQMHGSETPARLSAARAAGFAPQIKAVGIAGRPDVAAIAPFR